MPYPKLAVDRPKVDKPNLAMVEKAEDTVEIRVSQSMRAWDICVVLLKVIPSDVVCEEQRRPEIAGGRGEGSEVG